MSSHEMSQSVFPCASSTNMLPIHSQPVNRVNISPQPITGADLLSEQDPREYGFCLQPIHLAGADDPREDKL